MSKTMFEHVGGEETLRKLAVAFHHAVMEDRLLAPLFAYSGQQHAENLTKYFIEVFSGPPLFTQELGGFEYIKNRHARLRITEEQRNRFVELMLRAGEEIGLPTDERFQTAWRMWVDRAAGFSMKASHLTDEQLATLHSSLGRWDW